MGHTEGEQRVTKEEGKEGWQKKRKLQANRKGWKRKSG